MTSAEKMRAFYAMTPEAPVFAREFGFATLDRWIAEGHLQPYDAVPDYGAYLRELFGYDLPGVVGLGGAGWCEAAFCPAYEVEVLEDRGAHELVRDTAGRKVLYFKNRRSGFMPEYVAHPVHNMGDWQRDVAWRLDPAAPGRLAQLDAERIYAVAAVEPGAPVFQACIGGYMYLRSLIGPEELFYKFYDEPELIHACMQAWLAVSDAVIAHHQTMLAIDELSFGEDICYKNGCLISPDMMREFLLPYYQQLVQNTKRRNPPGHRLHVQIDTDGYCHDVIPLYLGMGMDYMSPFEVAAGSDILWVAEKYPNLLLSGGFDKRILAATPDAIDREIDRVVVPLVRRGGYIPTSDHDVPWEVPFANYAHYRKRMAQFS